MHISQTPKTLLTDFEIISNNTSLRKILVIGGRGIGKSSLLNKLMGFSEYRLTKSQYFVEHHEAPFKTGTDPKGVTKQTEYATGKLFNIESNPDYMFIDMPGVLDDLSQDENIQNYLNDLTGKLKLLKDITGVLVLIDSEEYVNSVEMRREDFITDGVMMILIAIQVIFEEQSKEDFAMNLAFGLAKCDPGKEKIWGKLQKDSIGVSEAIYDDLLENGIKVPSKNLPLFYLSSREVVGKKMVQKEEFRNLMEFFESKAIKGPKSFLIEEGEEIQTVEHIKGGYSEVVTKEIPKTTFIGVLEQVQEATEQTETQKSSTDEEILELNKLKENIEKLQLIIENNEEKKKDLRNRARLRARH